MKLGCAVEKTPGRLEKKAVTDGATAASNLAVGSVLEERKHPY